jgi:hypothetical protein
MDDVKNKEPETVVVDINENYGDSCIGDSVNAVGSSSRKPEGYVEIYSIDSDGNKQKVGKSNLVLYKGREWIASRLCNQDNINVNATPDQYLSWFGLGNEGSPAGDPLNPNTPINTMTGLSNEVRINESDTSCADLRGDGYYKHPFDSIEFQQDAANGNKWLVLKVTTTISIDDANGYNISEAGLYLSNSNAGEFAGPFEIFSIVTFPAIVKDNSRQLVFYWYLYC